MKSKISKTAVVLLSGGLDSATVLYFALAQGYQCQALIFDYGQRQNGQGDKLVWQRVGLFKPHRRYYGKNGETRLSEPSGPGEPGPDFFIIDSIL